MLVRVVKGSAYLADADRILRGVDRDFSTLCLAAWTA